MYKWSNQSIQNIISYLSHHPLLLINQLVWVWKLKVFRIFFFFSWILMQVWYWLLLYWSLVMLLYDLLSARVMRIIIGSYNTIWWSLVFNNTIHISIISPPNVNNSTHQKLSCVYFHLNLYLCIMML